MRILADYHHSDLWESLVMVLEDRFGWELYRPYGMGFYDAGIWQFERVAHGDAIAKQYLSEWEGDRDCGDHYERVDETHPGRTFKMVTLEQVRSQKWDVVMATLTENESGWAFLAKEIGAVFGIQIGNQWTHNRWDLAEFALCSTTQPKTPSIPHTFYHQEFSLKDFRFEYPPTERNKASTWVQCLSSDHAEFERFKALAKAMPHIQFRYHGHCGEDGEYWESNVKTTPEVAAQMRAAGIGIHFKTWSDGYGHVIHNLFAVGKPVVATASYYVDKLAAPLFVDGVTSFDVQTRTQKEVEDVIDRLVKDDDFHRQISENATAQFHKVVDFDADAESIRKVFEKVMP